MAISKSAGYDNLPSGNFLPIIYSQKVQKFFRTASVVEDITNTDYAGEIENFGDTVNIIKEPTIIYCFASTLKNKITNLGNINCIRGKRYFGPSKMSLFKLIIHSFSIIAVFKMSVFIRSALFLVLLSLVLGFLPILCFFFLSSNVPNLAILSFLCSN